MDAWAWGLRRLAPSMPRATRGIELGVVPAAGLAVTSFDKGAAEGVPLERAGRPFLYPANFLWVSLPGEPLATWPLRVMTADRLSDRVRAVCYQDPDGDYGNCDDGWGMYPTNAPEYMQNSALRAFASGKRWVHRTGHGVPGARWSVTEASSIRGFLMIVNGWIAELTADEVLLKSAPRYYPAYLAAKTAKQELRAAKGALTALYKAAEKIASYDRDHNAILYVSEAAGWFNGALNHVKAAQMNLSVTVGGREIVVPVDDLVKEITGIKGELGEMLAYSVDTALKELGDYLQDLLVKLMLEIGIDLTGKVVGSVVPILGDFLDAVIGAIRNLSKEKPGYIDWKRGPDRYDMNHLDTYGHLMHRVMEQHRMRVRAVRGGRVTWTELQSAQPPMPGGGRFRPEAERRLLVTQPGGGRFRPEEGKVQAPLQPPPEEAPPEVQKALSTTAKTGLVLGGGVAAAALIWWLSRRRR